MRVFGMTHAHRARYSAPALIEETCPMKIKGAMLYEQGLPRPYAKSQPLKIETLDLEGPRAGEVLVKVGAAGLCHSDLSTIEGLRPA
jgi:Zn-dependent alcohol dehydrogenase